MALFLFSRSRRLCTPTPKATRNANKTVDAIIDTTKVLVFMLVRLFRVEIGRCGSVNKAVAR